MSRPKNLRADRWGQRRRRPCGSLRSGAISQPAEAPPKSDPPRQVILSGLDTAGPKPPYVNRAFRYR